MTIFRSNDFHLKIFLFIFFLNIRWIYASVFNIFKFELNPLDNKKIYRPLCTFHDIFRTFHDNFQVKLFPLKNILVYFFLDIRWIYASVFNIFKFELNPLDNKKDIGHYVLFRTFHDNFQVKLFPPKIIFFYFFFKYSLHIS
jgi:hypothetical protein